MILASSPPKNLKNVQHWFASIISRPIDAENRMHTISPKGYPMETEAQMYVAPSSTLTSAQRIEIYNQQYWWRLLATLHESFPFLLRLFGYHDFNQEIGFPYLSRYTPNHWSLNYLGERLPYWARRYYKAADKELIVWAIDIDYAFTRSFVAPFHKPITVQDLEQIMEKPLYLQPHISLYTAPYPIFEFRDAMLQQEPEYWIQNDFPPLPRQGTLHYMVWRDHANNAGWLKLDPIEFKLLKQFKKGISFDAFCEWLETQPPNILKAAEENLQQWTHRWSINEWLTTQNCP